PVRGQQPGQLVHDMARDIEHGNIGDQREASGCADDLVVRTVLTGASRLPDAGASSSYLLTISVVHAASRRSFR
ncbi:hypothetical protein ACFYWP_39740, partial [Actinacidiphila glaucinigra]|uniref:hypothetical protein n=1 Tax=Actinacidiphila glaucinigra TaxID=235986 RepID=UPI0036B41F0B